MKLKFGLKWKLIGLVSGSLVLLSLASMAVTFLVLSRSFSERSTKDVETRSHAIDLLLESKLEGFKNLSAVVALDDKIISALGTGAPIPKELMAELLKRSGGSFLLVANTKGLVVAHSPDALALSEIGNTTLFTVASQGSPASGFDKLDGKNFALVGAAPILNGKDLLGVAVVGQTLTGTTAFVDAVKQTYSVECTVFDKDTRCATTIVRDGKRFVGTVMDNPLVLRTVIQEGKNFIDRNLIGGREYDTAYWPLHDAKDKVVGMGFIGVDRVEVQKAYLQLFGTLASVIVLIGGLTIALAFVVASRLAKTLHGLAEGLLHGSKEVHSAAGQVSTASQALANSSSEQASSLEEASASLEEMSSMTSRNADNAMQATNIAQQARAAAEHGSEAMAAMSKSMDEIKAGSDDIAKIIKTIDEIAFQTNILALNAAVEAARAGEAGAGFAVVAEEVRNLAQRSAEAARETSNLISTAITRTGQGVEINQRVAKSLGEIVERVREVDALVKEVSTASKEQSQGISQLNQAVSQMDHIVQNNAASSEETAAAASQLNAQSDMLRDTVAQLFTIVDGEGVAKSDGA